MLRSIRTSIATVSISDTLPEKLRAIKAAGFDGIEIFENDLLYFDGTPGDVRRMCADLGLEIYLFQPFRDFDGVSPERLARNVERAKRKFELMHELGTDRILVCSNVSPDTIRDDKPISVKGWRPENYTREYFGPVTLTQALANSLNTVSVRLTLEFGPTAVTRTAYRLGISSKLEPNASIALGTSEVSPLELVTAYVPFANGGFAVAPHVVERVRTADGKVLYTREDNNLGRVIEPEYVAMMNRMMRETLISGTARRADLPGWQAAGKTGTSQDFRDAWFIGYTGYLVTGVWLGNDDSSPTKKATGSGLPVNIWTNFMKAAHQGVPVAALPESETRRSAVEDLMPRTTGNGEPGRAPQPRRNDLDGWFIDRLFSRR